MVVIKATDVRLPIDNVAFLRKFIRLMLVRCNSFRAPNDSNSIRSFSRGAGCKIAGIASIDFTSILANI